MSLVTLAMYRRIDKHAAKSERVYSTQAGSAF